MLGYEFESHSNARKSIQLYLPQQKVFKPCHQFDDMHLLKIFKQPTKFNAIPT